MSLKVSVSRPISSRVDDFSDTLRSPSFTWFIPATESQNRPGERTPEHERQKNRDAEAQSGGEVDLALNFAEDLQLETLAGGGDVVGGPPPRRAER